MRSAYGCAGLGLLLLLVAGTFDAEPLYVTGSALALLGLGAAGWIAAGAWGSEIERELGARSVLEEQPLSVVITARSGTLPLPPGWIDEPLLPDPVRFKAGRRSTRVRVEIRFGRRGRRRLAPPVLVLRDPFGLAQQVVRGEHEDEILVLPRTFPVNVTATGGEAMPAHARAPASRDALDAAVRAAGSLLVHFARRTGCALLLPGDRRAVAVEPDLLAWPQAHVRLALLDDSTGPALTAAQNRRGHVLFVSARPVDRPPRGLGRTPGGCLLVMPGGLPNRRAVLEVAGCQGYVSGRTGGAAALAAVGGTG